MYSKKSNLILTPLPSPVPHPPLHSNPSPQFQSAELTERVRSIAAELSSYQSEHGARNEEVHSLEQRMCTQVQQLEELHRQLQARCRSLQSLEQTLVELKIELAQTRDLKSAAFKQVHISANMGVGFWFRFCGLYKVIAIMVWFSALEFYNFCMLCELFSISEFCEILSLSLLTWCI